MENNVGQVFVAEKAVCRVFNVLELLQLLRMDIMVFCSWGAQKFIVDNKKTPKLFRMTVNGHHHKGYVYITLNFLDLFDVYLVNKKGVIKDKMTDLYFDQLVEAIDEKIEKIDAYAN
jgi:hypothetical protein